MVGRQKGPNGETERERERRKGKDKVGGIERKGK